MDLQDYLRIARRRWPIIVVITVLACAAATAYSAAATRQYASHARVFISTVPDSTSDSAYQGGLFSQQRVASYADMMNGLELAQRVVDELHLDVTALELSGRISASAVPNTVLLDITVTEPSAVQAQRINQAVVQELQTMVADIETPPGGKHPLVKATVIDPPRLPTGPVSPRPLRNGGLALIVGLLLGCGVAVLREILDNSVKDYREVPAVHDVPLLGSLGYDGDVSAHPLISELPSHAPRAEAFRVLRTNLHFLDVDSDSLALVVTSAVPEEGKSTTAINTALALALANKSVVLVDADLRRPRVAPMLGVEGSVGLTTVLVGELELQDAIQRHAQTGLDVLTAGAIPPNPAELLQSNAMQQTLAQLRTTYDVIIIDAPPLLPVTDSALLAAEADGAVLVVRHGHTTKDQVSTAAERLRSVEAPLLGLVMNMVPTRRGLGGYGYGYGYGPESTEPKPTWRRRRTVKPRGAKA